MHTEKIAKLKKKIAKTQNSILTFNDEWEIVSLKAGIEKLEKIILKQKLTPSKYKRFERFLADFGGSVRALTMVDIGKYNENKINLKSLQVLTKLKSLYITCHNCYYIPSLRSLTNLTKLKLHSRKFNDITDIVSIESLNNIINLDLSRCFQILALQPLQSLTNITYLNLW
eukprot:Pgem_evm1s13810